MQYILYREKAVISRKTSTRTSGKNSRKKREIPVAKQ
jgi:hypothetical protein